MSLLGNIVWIVFGGLIAFLGWLVGGLVLCLTIVGIPFGLQAFKLAGASLAPFGLEIREGPHAWSVGRVLANVLWVLVVGWELALNHLFWALVLGITIIGIPFARQHLKLVPLALLPFGREARRVG